MKKTTRRIIYLMVVGLAPMLLILAMQLLSPEASAALAAPTFTVNSTGDVHAAAPLNDGICRTSPSNSVCTLRAAIEKANYVPGGGATIVFGVAPATYTLSIGQLVISNSMTILGAGPSKTVVDANGSVTNDRVLYVITHTVNISGVTMTNGRQTYTGMNPNAFAGGILHNDALTLTNSVVSQNSATSTRGAAYDGGIFSGGRLTLINSAVVSNIVTTTSGIATGGGILGGAGLTLVNSTVSGNTAKDSGGGIYGSGTLITSTVSGNTARNGGGINGFGLTLINSTVSGNHAIDNGGGIYHSSSTMDLFNATIVGNVANSKVTCCGYGGGIYNASSTVNFQNTILAYNIYVWSLGGHAVAEAEDCWGTLDSQGYNIVSSTTDCTVNGSVAFVDPNLGPLQNNGGPTPTHALLPGSRGIDEGQPGDCTDNLAAPITRDQRGYPRPADGAGLFRCDIGAFELQRLLFLPLVRR